MYSIEPYTYPGKLECAPDGGQYGVLQDEALENIDDFCSKFDGQKINQGERKDNEYFQQGGGRLSTISVSWQPDSVGCEKGGPFDHEYPINKVSRRPTTSLQPKSLLVILGGVQTISWPDDPGLQQRQDRLQSRGCNY